MIESREGVLLGAHIAADGQWRFPESGSIPEKYKACLLTFEDRYFYRHPGVNPASLARALVQNIRSRRVISGGSTITMQLIRLSGKGRPRTLWQKLLEMALAVRAELSYSKEELLALYASHAPFGGNVVGLDAAAWRYYGRNPTELSWAEAATLAVLPNAPSLIYPGRENELLLKKRNRLLDRLEKDGKIDAATHELAQMEPLPDRVFAVPREAPHLLGRVMQEHPGERIVTTVSHDLQSRVSELVRQHLVQLKANEIHNAAVLVMQVKDGDVLAYVGNSPDFAGGLHGEAVDIIRSPRSSGSILKPFLYAAMQDDGMILPNTLIPDIPTQIGGFSPQNFNLQYAGAVPASMALSRSLNIPAVRMLRDYQFERFYALMKKLNFSTLLRPASHYGLSLILGGAEVNLWDLAGAYASMGRLLIRYEEEDGVSRKDDFREPVYVSRKFSTETGSPPVSAGAAWLTLEALLKVNRPDAETGWESFSSSRQVAWKTGTSFGFRDAWAVGLSRDFVVAVWCGNADGEGRPTLTGTTAAAPLMFDVFSLLPAGKWFTPPIDEMVPVPVCRESGYRVGPYCSAADTVMVLKKGLATGPCPYCRVVHLDPAGKYRVTSACLPVSEMVSRSWFVLPPVMEWYYRRQHPFYKPLPPFFPGCADASSLPVMEMIYPRENNQVFVPVQLDGSPGQVILEAAHSSPGATIYWYLDEQYLGQTSGTHQMMVNPPPGRHVITLTDHLGRQLTKPLTVVKE